MLAAKEQWRILPLSKIIEILSVLPPPPTVVNGQAMMFIDPKAAERLHWIRDELMALLAQAKNLGTAEALEAMAQAHDAEEAAQKGEPTPWREDLGGQDAEWKSERRTAMLCALQAVGLA